MFFVGNFRPAPFPDYLTEIPELFSVAEQKFDEVNDAKANFSFKDYSEPPSGFSYQIYLMQCYMHEDTIASFDEAIEDSKDEISQHKIFQKLFLMDSFAKKGETEGIEYYISPFSLGRWWYDSGALGFGLTNGVDGFIILHANGKVFRLSYSIADPYENGFDFLMSSLFPARFHKYSLTEYPFDFSQYTYFQ